MKIITKSLLFITFFAFILIGCEKENLPPTCEIISPSNGAEFDVGDVITISVEANDEDGSISEVRFYINDIGVGSSTSFPYNYQWNTSDEEEGIQKIKVTAKDDKGTIAEDTISVLLRVYPPTLGTSVISSITTTSAVSGGIITNDGGETITARGVCWSESQNPTIADNITSDGTGTGTFTSSLTGLTSNTTYYVRAYATNSEETSYGNEVSFATEMENPFTDSRDGTDYNWVRIGDQIWMADNLAYLPTVSAPYLGSFAFPYYYVSAYQGSSVSEAKATANYQTYGTLYNWPAALNACPTGWHLPSDAEWTELTNYLAADGHSGSEGYAIKSTSGWNSDGNGTDDYGFSALPGRYRSSINGGSFSNEGYFAYFWSATEYDSSYAWFRMLYYDYDYVSRNYIHREYGYSVRCLRDGNN